ncbi:MAG: acyl carrier protein [Cyanobacteria bacterium J06554_3]
MLSRLYAVCVAPLLLTMDTQEILKKYISQTLLNGRMAVEADDDLLGEEIIDSMGVMRLIAFIEETFDCVVAQADITIFNFRTIKAIDAYLASRSLSV